MIVMIIGAWYKVQKQKE
jgi:hypothetical protein